MTGVRLLALDMLHFFWLLPLAGALFLYARNERRKAVAIFAGGLPPGSLPPSPARRFWKAMLVLAALALLILGLARPAWNQKESTIRRSGRDVVFLLDVSRSMLAEDLAPNRLERAKIAIRDLVEVLQGDRVGLVAFAGSASVRCPLTVDYGFFRMMLDDIGIESTGRGGTLIGDALRKACTEVFDDQAREYKDIVLITDGGDQESFAVEAAKEAAGKGIRLLVVGLGDEQEGARIPVTDAAGRKTFLKYQGQEVWAKLDGRLLREMAEATPGGRYLPVATGDIDLGAVYLDLIAAGPKKELEAEKIERYEEKFQIFLAAAFLLLLLETLVRETRGE